MMKHWHDSPDCNCHRKYGSRLIPEGEALAEENLKNDQNEPEHQRACYREADAQYYLTACGGFANERGILKFAENHAMSVDEADAFCKRWVGMSDEEKAQLPQDVRREAARRCREISPWVGESIDRAKRVVAKSDATRIVALTIDELLTRKFPPMEALLAPWLCKQHLSMVYAWRGVGKTHFALAVAYAVASGGTFLKWKADKPRRVVYIDGEMAGDAIKARIAAIVASTPDEHEPPNGYFRIITPDTQNQPLPDLASAEGQAALAPIIADADLIVVDNLSCLMRSGAENDGDDWMPVAGWALELRRQGKAVLFVHHAGKSKAQRGTSRREDLMYVVIKLDHAKDYRQEMGAAFTVEFQKARHLTGDDARNLEASLTHDEQGVQAWGWKDADQGMTERIRKLKADAPDLNQSQIAEELGCNRSTVSRALNGAMIHGAEGVQ